MNFRVREARRIIPPIHFFAFCPHAATAISSLPYLRLCFWEVFSSLSLLLSSHLSRRASYSINKRILGPYWRIFPSYVGVIVDLYWRVGGVTIFPIQLEMNHLEFLQRGASIIFPIRMGMYQQGITDTPLCQVCRMNIWVAKRSLLAGFQSSSFKGIQTSAVLFRESCGIKSFYLPICSYTYLVQAHPISAYPRCYGQDRRIFK